MNSRLKLYMKQKNTSMFFEGLNCKHRFIEQSPDSEFYKKVFSRANVINEYHDSDAAITALIRHFIHISKGEGGAWLLIFNSKDVNIDVEVELSSDGGVLERIIKQSVTSNGFLDDFVMINKDGNVIFISKDEYSYSVGEDQSSFYMSIYSSLVC
ncbi:hypothetical protein [Aeromonas hydrophila]|uniref:hypothetical protein n=1 Tax=Aeromonas hydrophila TaxID=644 RepID=UPI001FC8907E|nr:hypothetical protein [Aeromonas hydrophila]GKQ99258.1 hypothetical protein KAM461_35080 [Aeromonas hydrophila]